MWDAFHNVGLRSHYVATTRALRGDKPLMGPGSLVVNVSSFGGLAFTFNVAYSVGKGAVDRLSRDMAVDLEPRGIGCVSLWPGIVRTERLLKLAAGDGKAPNKNAFDLTMSESPLLSGRVVAALAAAPDYVAKRTGEVVVVAEAAEHFGIADEDGSRPVSIRSLGFALSYALGLDRASGGWGAWLMAALRYVKIPFGVFRNAKYAMERKQKMQSQDREPKTHGD